MRAKNCSAIFIFLARDGFRQMARRKSFRDRATQCMQLQLKLCTSAKTNRAKLKKDYNTDIILLKSAKNIIVSG